MRVEHFEVPWERSRYLPRRLPRRREAKEGSSRRTRGEARNEMKAGLPRRRETEAGSETKAGNTMKAGLRVMFCSWNA